jgi:hypothetical protein
MYASSSDQAHFTDGRKIVWEYPHKTPTGEQMDGALKV